MFLFYFFFGLNVKFFTKVLIFDRGYNDELVAEKWKTKLNNAERESNPMT